LLVASSILAVQLRYSISIPGRDEIFLSSPNGPDWLWGPPSS